MRTHDLRSRRTGNGVTVYVGDDGWVVCVKGRVWTWTKLIGSDWAAVVIDNSQECEPPCPTHYRCFCYSPVATDRFEVQGMWFLRLDTAKEVAMKFATRCFELSTKDQ